MSIFFFKMKILVRSAQVRNGLLYKYKRRKDNIKFISDIQIDMMPVYNPQKTDTNRSAIILHIQKKKIQHKKDVKNCVKPVKKGTQKNYIHLY